LDQKSENKDTVYSENVLKILIVYITTASQL